MSPAADIPLAVAIVIAACLLGGGLLALTGAIGLARLGNFYQRVHAPTLGATLAMFLILGSSILYFSVVRREPVLYELLIAIFLTLTTPISLMLVVRAALYRDRQEGDASVPPLDRPGAHAPRSPDA
jgi:multicomponent K+:H+ antiporter subunit G